MDTGIIDNRIDSDFLDMHGKGQSVNIEFEAWRGIASFISSDLSIYSGWRGTHRDIDFSDFSGYYLTQDDQCVTLWQNGVQEGSIRPSEGNNLIFDGFEDYISVLSSDNPSVALLDIVKDLCLSPENISKIQNEMNHGHEVIMGIEYNGKTVFVTDIDDMKMKTQLAGLVDDARFISFSVYESTMDQFYNKHLGVGPEPVVPSFVRYFYDGKTVYNEHEKDVIECRSIEVLKSDLALTEQFRDRVRELRDCFDSEVGVRPEHRPFLYQDAIFPMLKLHKDIVLLSSNYGRDDISVFWIKNGKVGVYDDVSVNTAMGKPRYEYSVEKMCKILSKIIMKSENIEKAKKEYLKWSKEQQMSESRGAKTSAREIYEGFLDSKNSIPSKGMKI